MIVAEQAQALPRRIGNEIRALEARNQPFVDGPRAPGSRYLARESGAERSVVLSPCAPALVHQMQFAEESKARDRPWPFILAGATALSLVSLVPA